MQTITFYAYKGGTGRTLALANAAKYLARLGQSVFAIDLDLEAPGLHHKLRMAAVKPGPAIARGVVDIIHGFYRNGDIPPSLSPYTVEVASEEARDGKITLMPAGNVLASSYWRQLAELNWHDLFYREGAEGVPFFLELKERIRAEFSPDFLLIDARTGITEVGGVATTLLPDLVVCLVLNNRENLEGAREVLRSISRQSPMRTKPIRIVPVLSRIPSAMPSETSDLDERLSESVRSYLCEPATEKEGSLTLPSVFVLHSEETLTIREALRVGGSISVDASPLLRDYLRLFAQIIPSEHVEPHLDRLIDAAIKDMLDRPSQVQSDLEVLANFCPHPKSYLALLKFYRLRDVAASKIMQTATRYWELSAKSDDPILWEIVSTHFRSERRPLRTERSGRIDQDIIPITEMVEAVWISSGTNDPVIGLRLVDMVFLIKRKQRAISIINRLLDGPEASDKDVVACINKLIINSEIEVAHSLVQQFRPKLSGNVDFQTSWAGVIVHREDIAEAKELLESKETRPTSIMAKNSDVYFRLLMLAGRQDELESTLSTNLDKTLKNEDVDEIISMYRHFSIVGKSDEFTDRVKKLLPQARADQVLSMLRDRYPGRSHRFLGSEIEASPFRI